MDPEASRVDVSDDGISRRKMLKRIGAGAAVAWTAPILTSVQTPAFAQGYDGTCADAILSGGPSPSEPVCVDDDIQVYLNGAPIFIDDDHFAQCWPPISVGLVNNGDQLRVAAIDSFGVCHGLSPLYLHCPSTGDSQTLDAEGVPGVCDGAPPSDTPFYDKTFTINL
jgi:hypothetical protein